MANSRDLSQTITMHPHPIHLYPNRSLPSTSRHRDYEADDSVKPSASTAFEAMATSGEGHDLVFRHNNSNGDVELQLSPQYTRENDPYDLSSSFKTETELSQIRANSSHKRDGCGCRTRGSKCCLNRSTITVQKLRRPPGKTNYGKVQNRRIRLFRCERHPCRAPTLWRHLLRVPVSHHYHGRRHL
jgi:hypothetical protein